MKDTTQNRDEQENEDAVREPIEIETPSPQALRIEREKKIQALISDEEDEILGKAYDTRLLRRLLGYTAPYSKRRHPAAAILGLPFSRCSCWRVVGQQKSHFYYGLRRNEGCGGYSK